MKRTIKLFAVAGVLVPILLMTTVLVELYINVKKVPVAQLLYPYLWPSSIILGATHSLDRFDAIDVLILVIAVMVNVLLYALIGLLASPAVSIISRWISDKPAKGAGGMA